MTETSRSQLRPWAAALIGVIVQIVLSAILDQFGSARDRDALRGTQALALLISTGLGSLVAARLSGRKTPAWIVAAVGLAAAIAYLYIELRAGHPAPLWTIASVLGAPLLGGRIGEKARA